MMGASGQPSAGEIVAGGRYRIESQLGKGGFGSVYRATQLTIGRVVALKVLHPELLSAEDGPARFQREAQLAQRLEHPNTVRLYDFGQAENGVPFIAFELLRGESLDQAIRSRGPMSAGRVARMASQVLKSLMEAHALGIVHRDIKPANIFLCEFQGEPDFVKVLDFGIAKSTASQTAAGLTKAGLVIGTPQYMAPEQLLGNASTPGVDLYALGLTMAEALCGRIIITAVNQSEIIMAQLSPEPLPIPPQVFQSPLGPIVVRATNKDAQRRYASAQEMLADLDALVRAHGGDLDRTGTPQMMPNATPISNVPTVMGSAPSGQQGTAFAPAPQYASAAPYLPASPQREPARSSSGGGAGVVIGILVALLLVGAVGSGVGYYLYASRGHDKTDTSDDDTPTKTKDKEKDVSSKKHATTDDDDDDDPSKPNIASIKKRLEAEGWKITSDSTSNTQGMKVVTLSVQKSSEYGAVYFYLYDDEKMAAMTEGPLGKNPNMVVRRKGGTLVAAYDTVGKPEAKSLLDDAFPP
jgi:serine/threonine-protein kinase